MKKELKVEIAIEPILALSFHVVRTRWQMGISRTDVTNVKKSNSKHLKV